MKTLKLLKHGAVMLICFFPMIIALAFFAAALPATEKFTSESEKLKEMIWEL